MTHTSICSRSIAAAIALTFASVISTATAQTTATTVPVGFITKTVPAAGASPSNTVLSIPLYQTAAFQSSVATTPTVGATSVTLNSATFTTTQFTTVPHLLRVKTGALTGKFWAIVATPAPGNVVSLKEPNSATGPGVADAVLTGLLAGDSCEILPANTFGSTFGAIPGIGAGTAAGNAGVDNVLIYNGVSYDTYFFHSTNNRWQRGISNATTAIIYPDDAVFFVRKAASTLPITLMGTVPSTSERTELAGAKYNFVANRFPTDATLGTSGIETMPGWIKGTSASSSIDTVLLWNGSTFDTYFYHTTNNRWQRGISNATTTAISAASGLFISRAAGSSDAVLTQNLPYTP